MTNNIEAIAATMAKSKCGDGDVESRLKLAMTEMKSFWASTDEDLRFRCAIMGVMLSYGEDTEEYHKLGTEVQILHALATGNFSSIPDPEDFEPIGLIKMWQEL